MKDNATCPLFCNSFKKFVEWTHDSIQFEYEFYCSDCNGEYVGDLNNDYEI